MIWLSRCEAHNRKLSDNLSTPCINFSFSSYILVIPDFDTITRSSDPFDPQKHVFSSLGIRFSSSVKFCFLLSHYLCIGFLYYKLISHRAVILSSFSAFFVCKNGCYSCRQPILYFIFFLRLLKSAAPYLCVSDSRLSQKFDIYSLLGASKLSYCYIAVVTFFRSWIRCHTKIFWNWSWSSRHLHYFFFFFYVLLTVHLSIILAINQLNAQNILL